MKKCKILSIVLAMVLFVASLNTGFISEAASKSAEYVYVMTKVQSVGTNYTNTLKYTYNADGLMKKEECIDKSPQTGDTKIVTSFTYSKGYIKNSKQVVHNNQENSPATYNSKYNYDSKKRLKKVVCNGPDNYEITTKIDYDKKNRKTKETMVITNWPPKCVNNYTYNKKGQIVKFSTNNFGEEYGIPVNEEFKYDKKGFINNKVTKSTFNGEVEVETTKRKAGYKNGRIVKATDKVYNKNNVCTDTIKTTYTYKRIKINKKYKKQIENQQAEIIFNVTR